ncbi:hypothetical protein SLE2022_080180 [Rubroshorea leprosula]
MSADELLINPENFPLTVAWNKLWKLRAPPKSKTLLWLIAYERVLTNSARVSRGLARSDVSHAATQGQKPCSTCSVTALHQKQYGDAS